MQARIQPGLEFVYEATGELEPPMPIGETYDGKIGRAHV